MKIVRKFLLLCLALIATDGYSQIGINQRGVSKNATAEFNVKDKGVLIPRLNLSGRTLKAPLKGVPVDGLTVLNQTKKGDFILSFWNMDINPTYGGWEEIANFDRLPRTALISFEGVEKPLLAVKVSENGVPVYFRSQDLKFDILNDGYLENLQVLPDDDSYGITFGISSGVYLIEFIAIYVAKKDKVIVKEAFNMAYFTDFIVKSDYKYEGPAIEGGPVVGMNYETYFRVERSTYSPVNEEHRVVFSNVFDLSTYKGKETLYKISLGLGRANNTNFFETFYFSSKNSYVKITKLK